MDTPTMDRLLKKAKSDAQEQLDKALRSAENPSQDNDCVKVRISHDCRNTCMQSCIGGCSIMCTGCTGLCAGSCTGTSVGNTDGYYTCSGTVKATSKKPRS